MACKKRVPAKRRIYARLRMSRSLGLGYTLVVGSFILCLCSIPSCVLAPVNALLKYLACVVIYPNVRLTWPGIASCIPDLQVLLQTNVCATVFVMYCVLWCLWPGRDKVCQKILKPLGAVKMCRNSWNSLLEHTRVRICQQGFCTWSDAQWLWYVSTSGTSAGGSWQPFPAISVTKLFSGSVWRPGSWKGVTKTVHHLHIHVHALIWRVTSYHVRLHLRIWLLLLERMFCRFISNKELFTAGPHCDVLKQHKVQYLLMRRLPFRTVSRWWGRACQIELPVWIRAPAYSLYIRMYGCKLDEALVTDLTKYRNLSEFFRRSLKPHLRPVDKGHALTSPADGRILHLGPVRDGVVEQVKGVTYSLRYFMGQDCNFMEAFKSGNRGRRKRGRQSTSVDGGQTFHFNEVKSNLALHSDFYIGKEAPVPYATGFEHRECGGSLCGRVEEISRQMAPYVDIGRLLDERGGAVSIIKGDPIDSADDNYHVEEVIYDQVFAIDGQNGSVVSRRTVPRHPDCLTPMTELDERTTLLRHEADFADCLLLNPGHVLYQCVVYLAPGDYHRFHSPADWIVYCRRHFPGNLFSVNPNTANWLQGLFVINERAMYVGRWKYGFFSMTAVGATNVGSINVFFDEKLRTNFAGSDWDSCTYEEISFASHNKRGVELKRGQLIGDFNLGSTIVLLFEAPPNFRFRNSPGDCIKYGQGLTVCNQRTSRKRHKQKK